MRTAPAIFAFIILLGCSSGTVARQEASSTSPTSAPAMTRLEDTSVVYDRNAVPEVSLEDSTANLPKLISKVDPVYPEGARESRVQGTVVVRTLISPTGNVRVAEVLKTDADTFNRPSLEAAMKWKFERPMVNGKPAAVWVRIPFRFAVSY